MNVTMGVMSNYPSLSVSDAGAAASATFFLFCADGDPDCGSSYFSLDLQRGPAAARRPPLQLYQ
jgi:hypothetical protein